MTYKPLSVLTSELAGLGSITLGETIKPMKGVWPAVDVTNGPLTADSGITAGSPSTSNRTLFTPGSDPAVLNLQSQYMQSQANGVGGNSSGQTVWLNNSGPRTWTFGTRSGLAYESNIDFGFITESLTVTVWYYHYNAYSGSNYHDMQMYVDHDGEMKKITRMPMTSTAGGGLMYRTLTFKEAREREFRILLPQNCWLIGVYIDTVYTIRKSPNKFFCLLNGDSWTEPAPNGTSLMQSPIGGAYPTGTYATFTLAQAIIEATGWAVGLVGQGGTGHFNVNDGVSHVDSYTSGGGASTFFGVSRVADMNTKFFAKNPLLWTIGGWNDGDLGGSPYLENYQARVTAGIDRCVTTKSDIKMIFSTIQPVASVGTTLDANRVQCVLGQFLAYWSRPDTVIGFVDETPMWPNMSTSGQRGNNVGPDTIHLHAKGAEAVANWHVAGIQSLKIPRSYYEAMLAAA